MKKHQIMCFLMAAALTAGTCPVKAAVRQSSASVVKAQTMVQDKEYTKEQELAKKLSLQLVHGRYDEICSYLVGEAKQLVNQDVLRKTWSNINQEYGKYQDYASGFVLERNGAVVVVNSMTYEKKVVKIIYTFDAAGGIIGFRVGVGESLPIPEVTEEYTEQSIRIGTYCLDGLLTMPKGVENPPVVILVQGSGSSDMNESYKENHPFEDIARGLAKQGIASIRYNKRYYQYPELADTQHITIQDEVIDDVEAAIEYAKDCGQVDSSRIVLAGHSLGGMIAPAICADHPELAGMISLAGSPRSLAEISYDQNLDALATMPLDNKVKKSMIQELKKTVNEILNIKEGDTNTYLTIPACYWYSLNQLDVAEKVKQLTMPLLFLQGRADFQVKVGTDHAKWYQLLKGKDNCRFITYGKLNHLFMTTNGKKDITEYDIPGHVEQAVIDDMAYWIHAIK